MKGARISLAVVCALVIGIYAYTARSGFVTSTRLDAADDYYNLLVQGFRIGQLSVKKEVPPGLTHLTDPYDPVANTRFRSGPDRLLDLSYYQGKLYLYFGITPAVLLFWPYVALTGHYLSQKDAGIVFSVVGFLASASLLYALWRRYFRDASVWVVAAGVLALGLTAFMPLLLARCDVYEVSISCGYMLTMLALTAIWQALHEHERKSRWLAAASLAYGLAVGARPTLLFGAVVLLVPVIQARQEGRQVWALLVAAIAPIASIGLGLMLYNALRFDSPFEFGLHYQLARVASTTHHFFGARFFWFNFLVYFLEPAHWSCRFPFVHDITVPPMPVGQTRVEHPFGLLTNIPVVWLALAVPLTWRHRLGREASTLRWFAATVAALFAACAIPLGFFTNAIIRFEADFAPALVLLAVIGLLGLERALAPTSESEQADRPVRRLVARCGWSVLLGFSVAFNLLASFEFSAEAHDNLGVALAQTGQIKEAVAQYEEALRINPDLADTHYNLGNALSKLGQATEAVAQFQEALRIKPDLADAQSNLGVTLAQTGKFNEAIVHYEQALRINSDLPETHYNLGNALARVGRVPEAIEHYEQALRINPDFTQAQTALAKLQRSQ